MLIPNRIRKRIGEIKRIFLIFRKDFLLKKVSKKHYRKKILPSQHPDQDFFNPHSLPTGRQAQSAIRIDFTCWLPEP